MKTDILIKLPDKVNIEFSLKGFIFQKISLVEFRPLLFTRILKAEKNFVKITKIMILSCKNSKNYRTLRKIARMQYNVIYFLVQLVKFLTKYDNILGS